MSNIEPTPFGDKYVLVEHIATGGMAEIYRAQYAGIEGFAKELVVKTLREEFAARPEVVGMFLDEARVAATLTHNNVVHTYDLGELGGEYFIAMELLKGEELVNVMRRAAQSDTQGVPLELAIGIIMQSCEGLHYVHSRRAEDGTPLGLVHRDINPTNIHVGYDGICKILDFGIAATRASAIAKKGQVAGKLSYMAPEQLLGHPIDQRADIFPLGVVLYELCLGRRLFRGSREEVTRRVLEGDVPAPTMISPKFPPALEAIIMRTLEVDPADRYQNCDHLFRDLEAFCTEARLSWTPRKISAFMSTLFGSGAPADVDYDDQYSDLDEALDFAAFEGVPDAPEDDVPEWARGVESNAPVPEARKRAMTIGNIEALVSHGRLDESGPNPVARAAPPTQSAPARPPVAQPSAAAPARTAPAKPEASPPSAAAPAAAAVPEAADPTRSGLHRTVATTEDAGDSGRRRRPPTASRPAVRQPVATSSGRAPIVSTGPLASLAPDAVSGRTFGHSVVSDESRRGGAAWAWIIGVVLVSGLGYVAYALLTTK